MTDLGAHLERLGLEQYLRAFVDEGFESWETLLDIQERDLELLNVKLGHRRKLQRAIADYRGISYDRILGSPAQDGGVDHSRQADGASNPAQTSSNIPTETKRRYRRHPKVDENAPEKPPSAYVLFSNRVREEVKGENLSFADIAKLVGDRWQKLEPSQKEPFETQASSLKEQYNAQLSAYKRTDSYREYAQYLADFKAKHGQTTESKRPKLDAQSSGGSASAASQDMPDASSSVAPHARTGSMGSISMASHVGSLTSPTSVSSSSMSTLPTNQIMGAGKQPAPVPGRPASPSLSYPGRDRRLPVQFSTHSSLGSVSDEPPTTRGDLYESLSRTSALSHHTPPAGTPPLPPYALSVSTKSEHSSSSDNFAWSNRLHQTGSNNSSLPSPHGSNMTLPSPTAASDNWRERSHDAQRPMQSFGTSITLPLPPLLGTDRLPDLARPQPPRTLPPLRHTPIQSQSQPDFPGRFGSTTLPHHASASAGERERLRSARPVDGWQADRNENEAANTLAELAKRPGADATAQQSDRRRWP